MKKSAWQGWYISGIIQDIKIYFYKKSVEKLLILGLI